MPVSGAPSSIRSRATLVATVFAAALWVTGVGEAQAQVITFTGDTTGAQANGFTSVDSAVAHFTDSIGANLQVTDFGSQSNGNALGVFSDDPSVLIINFDVPMSSITLSFGNDDACCSSAGDVAQLTVFNGGVQVGQAQVVMNRNDLMDQTITVSGVTFNEARFAYASPGGAPINLIEIVDDITLVQGVPALPALALAGLAVLLMVAGYLALRRREGLSA